MYAVVLDALEDNSLSAAVRTAVMQDLGDSKGDVSYFRLKDQNIGPCRSCGACAYKSPGKCIINDDTHPIMRAIAQGGLLVLLTPIRFGGHSALLKKAMDKFMPLGAALYFRQGEHLLHPMRYRMPFFLGVGVAEAGLPGEEDAFRLLVSRNALNTQAPYRAVVIHPQDSDVQVAAAIRQALEEVHSA